MKETAKLAERHAREWEAAAGHADDLVAARTRATGDAPPPPLDDELARALADRADCERALARMQWQPFESLAGSLPPADAHKGVLARVAEQLDLVIATMFEPETKEPAHGGH